MGETIDLSKNDKQLVCDAYGVKQDKILQSNDFCSDKKGFSGPAPLAKKAYYGLAGDVIKTIEPHTEADPVALLLSLFVLYGNVIGKNSYFLAEADKHFCNIFGCLVGETAKSRKGSSLGQIKQLFDFEKDWLNDRIFNGLSSGEGLIWQVRDLEIEEIKSKNGNKIKKVPFDGIADKRLTVIEQEFASIMQNMQRKGNTLSPVLRKAWDGECLQIPTKNNPAKATDAHISILAHITKDELLRYLGNTEIANGFGNRFLWANVKRSKSLPDGGNLNKNELIELKQRLSEAVKFGKQPQELKRNEDARLLWHDVYQELSEGKPGLTGALLARSEAQVMRLASIYALLDCYDEITPEHLSAALAIWAYCEESVQYIFENKIGNPVADLILKRISEAGKEGVTRTDINNYFSRNKTSAQINQALNYLETNELIVCDKSSGNGRPVERWIIQDK